MPYFPLSGKKIWPVVSAHPNSGLTQALSFVLVIITGNTRTMKYSCLRPLLLPVKPKKRRLPAYEKMDLCEKRQHKPVFGGLGRNVACDPVQLSYVALLDALLEKFVKTSNAYAKQRLPEHKQQADITCADILIFIAIYYYMGLVKLPLKRDYWRVPDGFWPVHPITAHMKRDRFKCIWHNVHLTAV